MIEIRKCERCGQDYTVKARRSKQRFCKNCMKYGRKKTSKPIEKITPIIIESPKQDNIKSYIQKEDIYLLNNKLDKIHDNLNKYFNSSPEDLLETKKLNNNTKEIVSEIIYILKDMLTSQANELDRIKKNLTIPFTNISLHNVPGGVYVILGFVFLLGAMGGILLHMGLVPVS